MSETIFGSEAPKYWERNLPVIPVNGKIPIHQGWQGNLGSIPNEERQRELIATHPGNNIGALLGLPVDGDKTLVALDVDDDRLLAVSLQLLGLNRAERRTVLAGKKGKKGATIFVRAPKSLKSTVIKGTAGLGNIDFLAAGKMTVMPPSVHPETGKPYEVSGKSLLDVDFADLPEITEHHIKLLKATIGSEYAIVLIEGNATHDAGVALTGVLVHSGATDEEIADIFIGLLPNNYDGDSLKELSGWIKSAREKGFDETKDDGGTLSAKLVALALSEGMAPFRDEAHKDIALTTLPHTGPAIAYRVNSSAVKLWLRHLAHKAWGKPMGANPLSEAIATLEAIGLFDGPSFPVYARVAGDTKSISIDLGRQDGRMIKISPDGQTIESNIAHKFVRGAGFESLPLPEASGGGLRRLQSFLGLDDQNYRLLLAFLINALKPQGPYFILLVEGEQGSGKSFFCEIIKRIIDPNQALRLRLPDKPQDLMIQAKEYWLLSFDNASGMKAEMSDILCSLATGGGIAVRRLYTDDELHVLTYMRPFMINGISGYATRPDLMERAIPIKLPPIGEGERKTEAELMKEFQAMLPLILAELYDGVAYALLTSDEVEPPRHLRMADAARWIRAAEEGLGEQSGAIIDAIALAQNEFIIDRVNDDPLVMALRTITARGPFEGYVGDLFVRIAEIQERSPDRGLPQSPSRLSNQLDRMRPAMAKAGVMVEFLGKDRRGRRIKISSDNMSLPKFW
ncbi:bifunctional DNA primase/polymerase [Mesorhizobium sp. M0184]|uniref:bifunctional DNA primase/polymerase n=1 Tax=Mesorhizobium sp. M0184 TaxID=2956906 RepID=UPI00333BB4AF